MGSTLDVRRGDIFYADLSPVVGSEQGGLSPLSLFKIYRQQVQSDDNRCSNHVQNF